MTVAERLAQVLAGGAVHAMFGVPGLQTLPIYDAAERAGLTHVLMRDERAAACAADAYARLSGTVGICDATVGPGATNIVSGIAEAFAASIPVLAVIADVRGELAHLRRRAVVSQAVDQAALFGPITKWFARVDRPDLFEPMLDQALRIATTGRPGPVVLEIPEDVIAGAPSAAVVPRPFGPETFRYPRHRSAPAPADIESAVAMIASAKRPLLLCGGGGAFSDASAAITDLAETHQIPVITTVSGKGALDESSALAGGVTGVFGTALANSAMAAADLVIALGCKFGQFTTHYWQQPRADQAVIHVDLDGEEIGRAIAVRLGIVADARETAGAFARGLTDIDYAGQNWLPDLASDDAPPQPASEGISPRVLSHLLSDALHDEDVLVCDASLSSGWGASGVLRRRSRSFIAPRGLAGIGWSGGASIGARYAVEPGRRVVVLAGDGGWGYSMAEVETAARMGLDLTYIVLNNSALAWIRHSENRLQYEPQSSFAEVDFAAVARAMSAHGTRVTHLEHVEGALHQALSDPGPHVLDVVTTADETPVRRLGDSSASAYA